MLLIVLLLLIVIAVFGVGFIGALHFLWWIAAALLILWLIGLFVGRTGGRRGGFYWW